MCKAINGRVNIRKDMVNILIVLESEINSWLSSAALSSWGIMSLAQEFKMLKQISILIISPALGE